jgi:hypothetical protein
MKISVPAGLNHSREVVIDGVKLHAQLSPFDCPVEAETTFDSIEKTFTLELCYPDGAEELAVVVLKPADARFHVGRKSGRLFRLQLQSLYDPTTCWVWAAEALNDALRELDNREHPWLCLQGKDDTLGRLTPGEGRWPAMQQLNYRVIRDFIRLQEDR